MEKEPRNAEALALAYKSLSVHLEKVAELGIKPDFTEDQIDELVKTLSEAKAAADNSVDWKKFSKGQQFYVEQLVKEAGMTPAELLDYHYKRSFADVATEYEMLEQITAKLLAINTPVVEPTPTTDVPTEAA